MLHCKIPTGSRYLTKFTKSHEPEKGQIFGYTISRHANPMNHAGLYILISKIISDVPKLS